MCLPQRTGNMATRAYVIVWMRFVTRRVSIRISPWKGSQDGFLVSTGPFGSRSTARLSAILLLFEETFHKNLESAINSRKRVLVFLLYHGESTRNLFPKSEGRRKGKFGLLLRSVLDVLSNLRLNGSATWNARVFI